VNTGQIIYALALAGVFLWRGPSHVAWVLLANMAATLAACLALDLGMARADATKAMMLIDMVSAAVLIVRPGLPQLVSVGYVATFWLYMANLRFGLSEATTFAVVVGLGFLQIMVAAIGTGGNNRGGSGRVPFLHNFVAPSRRVGRVGAVGMAQSGVMLSQDRGGMA
jgi:hypothetical protein